MAFKEREWTDWRLISVPDGELDETDQNARIFELNRLSREIDKKSRQPTDSTVISKRQAHYSIHRDDSRSQ